MEGWDFIVAGGGLFNNLDYSFVAGYEDGTFVYPPSQPGGGSPALRRQYGFLKRTIQGMNFTRMRPQPEIVSGELPEGVTVRALGEPGRAYLLYLRTGLGDRKKPLKTVFKSGELTLQFRPPDGSYRGVWLSPETGHELLEVKTRPGSLGVPAFADDITLILRKD
jgi:hypothetical protein